MKLINFPPNLAPNEMMESSLNSIKISSYINQIMTKCNFQSTVYWIENVPFKNGPFLEQRSATD